MGLLDHYRQFEGMSDEEISRELRERADERRRRALAVVEPLDLSMTSWHELPHPNVVAAVTYAARRGINRYADPQATALRRTLASRHDVAAERIVVGNGIAELLGTAAAELLEPRDELVTFWPSYPLFPLIARRAGAQAVPVWGHDPEALLQAVSGRTRVIAIANPNDPTGGYLSKAVLRELLARLPERVVVLLDEALSEYADAEPPGASLGLLDEHPRLIILRTFSKAFGLSGLRCGYALGGHGSESLLERLAPPLGVNALSQAGALEALASSGAEVATRRAIVIAERGRLLKGLQELPADAPPSQANFIWLRVPGVDGAELAARLEARGVIVRGGDGFGDADHVRVAVQSAEATDRLLRVLRTSL
ncbi:MAG TPA: aminotransferase class I/II-fold pyridoxal phosphate-dependent enzyme [Solirubrobacteraceae bacterium]|nr:aminotransferase class I/II-fold pyridoxal phosphate-dependent enzyme [Solirubrobacteraceae bacterium]